jgi:phage shock protein C
MKKLYKSEKDIMVAGVLAGIAEYFNGDPTIFRLAYVVLALITGIFPCVLAYILACLIIPNHSEDYGHTDTAQSEPEHDPVVPTTPETQTEPPTPSKDLFRVAEEEMHAKPEADIPSPVPPHVEGELKKPNWPNIGDMKKADVAHEEILSTDEHEPETATLDSLLDYDDDSLGLDDLIDE